MKAMILAAGRGERMRPLTDQTPKPLLEAGGKPLIVHHIERLRSAGYEELVINTHHLGAQVIEALGDGSHWGVRIQYSPESPIALETAGGIGHALPLLGNDVFLVINGDVWCDHDLTSVSLDSNSVAHLVLVPNPEHNPRGDFDLNKHQLTNNKRYTFSGIGWYRPELFKGYGDAPAPLAPLLREAIDAGRVNGEVHCGEWMDIGTPERLQQLDQLLQIDN